MEKTLNVNLLERNKEEYRRTEGEKEEEKIVDSLNSPMCEYRVTSTMIS